MEKLTVGWREWLALPALGIPAIKAKVDTGAKTSSLHAFGIEPFRRDGKQYVRFTVHPLQFQEHPQIVCEALLLDQRVVSDSGGHRESRFVIETPLHLGDQEWPIQLTLTNRGSMRFRMLLGRRAMRNQIMVEPNASYVNGKLPVKKIYAGYT